MSKISKDNLKRLLDLGYMPSRSEIVELLGVTESEARTYHGVLDNYELLVPQTKDRRVLVIGDLHEPFILDGYFEFCVETFLKYQCTETLFIGDVIDLHYSSFYDTDPDGDSAKEELLKAKADIKKWHEYFSGAKVTIGNHDRIADRKRFSAGISSSWIRPIGEVLDTPSWTYAEDFVIDGVVYTHGEGRQARQRCQHDMINVVQGHWHSKSYIEHYVGLSDHIWAMQIGCGVNRKAYAMAYGKHFDKPHINCGVVLENGKLPILEYMKL